MANDKPSDRAVRMVDFTLEEAGITFKFGSPVTEEQVEEMQQQLDAMEVESE